MAIEPWERLAEAVRARRTRLLLSQSELANRAGTSESTVRSLESGRRQSFRSSTMRALTEALNWTPDSIERVLRGDEPHLAKPEGPPLAESDILAEVARLRARIEEIEARLASERPADDGPGTSRSA